MSTCTRKTTDKQLSVIADLLADTPEVSSRTVAALRKSAEKLDEDPSWLAAFQKGRIVERILEEMRSLSMTQSDLARKWGKSRQYVGKVLNDQNRSNFTVETLCEIFALFDLRIDIQILAKNEFAHVVRTNSTRSLTDPSSIWKESPSGVSKQIDADLMLDNVFLNVNFNVNAKVPTRAREDKIPAFAQ